MKENIPDFKDGKIRTWLRRPEDAQWEGLEEDPSLITIDEETEEIYESRTYRLKPDFQTFGLLLRLLLGRSGEEDLELPPEGLAHWVTDIIEDTSIKFLSKRRKQDGRITYVLTGITRDSRWLLDRAELVDESQYRKAVREFECLPLFKTVLSSPLVVTIEEWRRYGEEEPLPKSTPARGRAEPSQRTT